MVEVAMRAGERSLAPGAAFGRHDGIAHRPLGKGASMTARSILSGGYEPGPKADAERRPDWHVAIFCWNERERIAACIEAVDKAIGARRGRITVLLNGSTDGSALAASLALKKLNRVSDLVELELGDKSEAINHFIATYGPDAPGSLNFFVDGYVLVAPGAFEALEQAMLLNPAANAASGFSSNGRSEVSVGNLASLGGGKLRGALYCLRPSFVARVIAGGYTLPTGLYRGDGLLGSMVCHDLNPVRNVWNPALCLSVPESTFEIYSLSPLRPSHYARQFRRKVRQMRGKLENAAIKAIVHTEGFGALPRDCNAMIRDYVKVHGVPRVGLVDRVFLRLALAGARRG